MEVKCPTIGDPAFFIDVSNGSSVRTTLVLRTSFNGGTGWAGRALDGDFIALDIREAMGEPVFECSVIAGLGVLRSDGVPTVVPTPPR